MDVSEAPNPQGASGREWCYVEPQVDSCVTWNLYLNKSACAVGWTHKRRSMGLLRYVASVGFAVSECFYQHLFFASARVAFVAHMPVDCSFAIRFGWQLWTMTRSVQLLWLQAHKKQRKCESMLQSST